MKPKPKQIPCLVRSEIGGGTLIIFPTIPHSSNTRTAISLPVCYSNVDGHSCVDHGYYIKHTKPASREQAEDALRRYAAQPGGFLAGDTEFVLVQRWTPDHDELRNHEAWKAMVLQASDRFTATSTGESDGTQGQEA